MKVLLIGEDKKGSMAWFVKRAFEEMNIEVSLFDHRRRVLNTPWKKAIFEGRKFRPRLFRRDLLDYLPYMKKAGEDLIRVVKKLNPDFVLVTKGETLQRELVRNLREESKMGIVNWFPDNPFYDPLVMESLDEYTLFFVKDPYIVEEIKKLGATNVLYLPFACDPEIHKALNLNPEEISYYGSKLSFVGSLYPYRVKILEAFSNCNLKIWGSRWERISPRSPLLSKHQRKEVIGWEQAAVFNASFINLNIHHPNDIYGVNMRVFDIAGSGGFQLVDYKKGIERVFSPRNEIVTYRSLEELKELVNHFLENAEERKTIAKKAQERAHREHTYILRVQEILECMEVKANETSLVFT